MFMLVLPLTAEEAQLKKIEPVPRLELQHPGKESVVGEYHGRGVVDAVQEQSVVINDTLFSLPGSANILYEDGSRFAGKLKPGTAVFYYLDGPRRIDKIFIGN